MSTRFECDLASPPRLARRAYVSYAWRRNAGWLIGSLLVAAACAASFPDREMRPLAAFGFGVPLMWWASWIRSYRVFGRSAGAVPSMHFTATEEGCTLSTGAASGSVRWSTFKSLSRLPLGWFLVGAEATGPVVLPAAGLSDECRAFIEAQVRLSGGRVF